MTTESQPSQDDDQAVTPGRDWSTILTTAQLVLLGITGILILMLAYTYYFP